MKPLRLKRSRLPQLAAVGFALVLVAMPSVSASQRHRSSGFGTRPNLPPYSEPFGSGRIYPGPHYGTRINGIRIWTSTPGSQWIYGYPNGYVWPYNNRYFERRRSIRERLRL